MKDFALSVREAVDRLDTAINDVFDCPGGHKLDEYDKKQVIDAITEAHKKELEANAIEVTKIVLKEVFDEMDEKEAL